MASSQLGDKTAQQGLFQLGAPGSPPTGIPAMPTSARPLVAHLYNNDWSFRASLGPLVSRPVIKQTLNSGIQPFEFTISALNTVIQPGNVVVLTEEAGDATGAAPAGIAIAGGTIEDTPDTLSSTATEHKVSVTPFVAELGDAYLNKNYTTPTDVSQMVRDAIAQSAHLRYTNISIPNSGVLAVYNFTYAPALEVINIARLIAGLNYSWFVDAIGMVWFQAINTSKVPNYTVSLKDYQDRTYSGPITNLKNYVLVTGGIPLGSLTPATATYDPGIGSATRTNYGLRAMNPPLNFPSCTDQSTLNAIAATVGAVFDRIQHRITITLPAFPGRVLLGQQGGAVMRYFEPAVTSLVESGLGIGITGGAGNYSPNYVVLDVELTGIQQKVTLGDVPVTSVHDLQYQLDRMVSRVGMAPIAQTPFVGPNVVNANGTQNPTNTGPRVVLDGSVPLVSVNDGTYQRAQMGNLLANGNSPAQYGFRALDSNGNPIFDSLGLLQSMALLASIGGTAATITSATFVTVASTTVTIASRTQNIYVIGSAVIACTTTGAASTGFWRLNLNGQLTMTAQLDSGTGKLAQTLFVTALGLAPGTYNLLIEAKITGGTLPQFFWYDTSVNAYLIGG